MRYEQLIEAESEPVRNGTTIVIEAPAHSKAARRRGRFWLKLVAAMLFAVVAYGGAYAALVRPMRVIWISTPIEVKSGVPAQPYYTHLFSRSSGTELRPFFALAHWFDRKLRPEVWE